LRLIPLLFIPRKFISEPVMVPRYNIPLEEERDLALRRLQRICDNKFISVLDFWHNPLRIFAAHELAAIIDPAMTTKMTVQFNLFGGTVLKLGTERHHKDLLAGIDNLQVHFFPLFFFSNSFNSSLKFVVFWTTL
jgi:acyl-CoA oxidase